MHIMVDLETMGSRPGSAIASIGAVAFDPIAGVTGFEFYEVVELASCEAAGLKLSADTVMWWLKQGDDARKALGATGRLPIAAALARLSAWWRACEWWSGSRAKFWSHGANFDEPMLSEAYAAVGQRPPWSYSASRCTRTIYDLAGVKVDRAAGTHHNALDDARAQAFAVMRAYRSLGLAPWNESDRAVARHVGASA